MAIGAAIGGSALLGAVSSNKAAKAQKSAANNQLALQREMYDQTRDDLSPYREGGQDAVTAQNYLLGLSTDNRMSDGSNYSFETSPGYQFNLEQGLNAIDASAATKGGLLSGATLKAAQEYGSGLASDEYWKNLNALSGLSGMGQSAAAGTANANLSYGNAGSSAIGAAGNAASAAYTGTANSLTSGVQDYLGYSTLNNYLTKSLAQQAANK